MFNSFQIANYFISAGQESGVEITPMKLIKLCYIAHGWNLGFTGKPLLSETVYAWKYGPVIDTLYDAFKVYGSTPIKTLYSPNPFDNSIYPMPSEDIKPFLDSVWKAYGKYDGVQLSAMTHQKGTPWYQVWNGESGKEGRHIPIPNKYIEAHYKAKIEDIKQRKGGLHPTA